MPGVASLDVDTRLYIVARARRSVWRFAARETLSRWPHRLASRHLVSLWMFAAVARSRVLLLFSRA